MVVGEGECRVLALSLAANRYTILKAQTAMGATDIVTARNPGLPGLRKYIVRKSGKPGLR